jgi:hypothetical protein
LLAEHSRVVSRINQSLKGMSTHRFADIAGRALSGSISYRQGGKLPSEACILFDQLG